MAIIPDLKTTLTTVEDLEFGGKPRTYLGMSAIGEECTRLLWYNFHWATTKKHSAKTERIFDAGHLFEAQIIKQLKLAGCEVFRVDKDGNEIELYGLPEEEQEEFVDITGHSKGHCDGRIRGLIEAPKTVHTLEIKTMAQKYFTPLTKKGVQETNPKYYAQMQRYMLEQNLTRAFFVAMNKNTCELHFERINFDKEFAEILREKGTHIIFSEEPPTKEFAKDFYKCNWCDHKEVCHEDEPPEKNCRTCDYSDMEDKGKWTCTLKNKNIPEGLQRKGCSSYKIGWGL
jgi:hypothetical protein